MAFCVNCGNQLAENAKFCTKCGTPTGVATPQQAAPLATEKVGNIRKCPACGAEVPAMAVACSECGHEFSNVRASNAVREFFEKLDNIDQQVFEKEAAKEAKGPLGGAVGAMLGLDGMAKMFTGTSAGAKRKISMIEGFPIPNSKEDIIEFILLASSRYRGAKKPLITSSIGAAQKMEEFKLDDAWRAKCEQAYTKAKLTFGSDKAAIAEIENILKKKKIIK